MTNRRFGCCQWNAPGPWKWLATQKSCLIPTYSCWPLRWRASHIVDTDKRMPGWRLAKLVDAPSFQRPTLDSWQAEALGLKCHFSECSTELPNSVQTRPKTANAFWVPPCSWSSDPTGVVQRWQCSSTLYRGPGDTQRETGREVGVMEESCPVDPGIPPTKTLSHICVWVSFVHIWRTAAKRQSYFRVTAKMWSFQSRRGEQNT